MQVRSFDEALDFLPAPARSAKEHGLLWTLAKFLTSISDGLAASREYDRLVGQGVASDEAARRAFQMLERR
jgi:hypothetical protein